MAVAAVDDRELIKAMSWFDGFVVALANPSFLLTALGGSVLSLGGWGAAIVWTFSVFIGALHNNIYAEVATMFPKLSGGVAVYAHEAWKRYTSFVGPIAAVGYWLGWSVVLSLNGAIVGFLLQSQFFADSTCATGTADWWVFTLSSGPAILIGAVLIVIIWVANVFGVRPAVWTGYVTGVLLLFPLFVLIFLPYITGDWSSSNLHSFIDWGNTQTAQTTGSGDSLVYNNGWRLVITWLYLMCWSSYGFECCASFAPEYRDPERDTAKALRAAAVFGVFVYALPADRRPRHVRRPEHHARQHAHVLRPDLRDPRRPRRRQRAGGDALCGHRALHEHGHHGRIESALRHIPGRHDDQVAGQAQPQQRARQRHDAGCRAQPRPPVPRDRDAGGRRLSQDPRGLELRLRDSAHLRDLRLPAPAQGPARAGRARSGSRACGYRSRSSA